MRDEPIDCFQCGTCCIAPDISTLQKPVGVPCVHLQADRRCGIYPLRPPVCREYRPDDICCTIQQLPPEARVPYYLALFDLTPASDSPSDPSPETR